MPPIRSGNASTASTRIGVALATLLILAGPPASGQTIDTVIVESANVFDERDGSTIARWVNALHVTTSPWVIRRTLLFRPGEPYDSARVVESARALRGLQIFRHVSLDTLRVNGRFAARVRTADGWSTRPTFGFNVTDGDATWSVGIREGNLLGSAITAGFRYRKTPDRQGLEIEGWNPHFLARHTILGVHYRSYNDGRRLEWLAGQPFRERAARAGLVTSGLDARERTLVFRDGVLDTAVVRWATIVGLRGGIALSASPRSYVRLWGEAQWRRENFTADTLGAIPAYSTFTAAGAGVAWAHVRLRTAEGVNSFGRQEDFDLSQLLRVGVWVAPRAWGYPGERAGAGPEVLGQLSTVWHRGFGILRVSGQGIYTAAGLDSGRVEGALTLMSQNLPRQTVILHVDGGLARSPAPGAEFDLWVTRRGPRLFGAHAFTGTRRAWIVLEDRILVDDEWLRLVGVGLAPFVEWGGAWYVDQPARTGLNTGLALRLGPTRATSGRVFELAGGWRYGAGWDGRRWAISIRSAFAFPSTEP